MTSSLCIVQARGGECLCEQIRRFEEVAGNDGGDEDDDDRSDLRCELRSVGTRHTKRRLEWYGSGTGTFSSHHLLSPSRILVIFVDSMPNFR